ncbi:NSFL1 cofactor p47-like [Littorina saxatilis]|uniref:NSFL1 cofactor p47-like n=1 Tax=Littorina saxatilis TaxID=31220 RepID=UPI0038B41996
MADQDEMIGQFANVTGVNPDRAKFHLESSAWNLEVAIANFYEGAEEHDVDEGSAANPLDADDFDDVVEEPQPLNIKSSKKAPKTKNSRFGTIGGLRADEDSSSEEEGQAFYAGGSDTSGQQVLGPPSRKKKNPEGLVTDLFQSAREHGAEEMEAAAPPAGANRGSAFRGAGYRLGETEGPLESVAGPSLRPSRPEVQMTLKMWKKGFSVDNGDLREYDDPRNKEFLDSIREGTVPQELIRTARGGEVHLNMEDHRTEDFVKPKVNTRPFTGEGHMLGSPAPVIVTTASSGDSSATPAAPEVKIDSSKPVTTLQIRLADGKRMVSKFNLTHTVGDIRNHIVSSYPQYTTASFVLMTTFPNKELTEESLTLDEAKLANAVIVQRMK